MKKHMNKLKLFGVSVIALVITAFLTTPAFFAKISLLSHVQVVVMLLLLIIVCITTIIMVAQKQVSELFLVKLIIALFLVSTSVFFGNPEYFHYALELPLSFWHRVSFYTLPVIVFESALITGFILFMDQYNFTKGERIYIYTLFGFYSLTTIGINFMTLGNLFTIESHIKIARVIIITFAVVAPVVLYRSIKKPV